MKIYFVPSGATPDGNKL